MQSVSFQSIRTGIVLSILTDKKMSSLSCLVSLPGSFIPFFCLLFFPQVYLSCWCSFHISKYPESSSDYHRSIVNVFMTYCILLLTAHWHVKLATFPLLLINCFCFSVNVFHAFVVLFKKFLFQISFFLFLFLLLHYNYSFTFIQSDLQLLFMSEIARLRDTIV